jgi:hypothetical protein
MKELYENLKSSERVDLGDLKNQSELLQKSGLVIPAKMMRARSEGYLPIEEAAILKYLVKLVETHTQNLGARISEGIYYSVDYHTKQPEAHAWLSFPWGMRNSEQSRYMKFDWIETPVKHYNKIPPQYVAEKIIRANSLELFDKIVVAEIGRVNDPLILGRIDGTNIRFFIAQFDDDIKLDDLI